jgi:Tol biopolymer transport system component
LATTTLAGLFALAFGWSLLRPEPPDPPGPVTRVSVNFPEDQFFYGDRGDLDLSADGSLMVYVGVGDPGSWQLWARRFDELDATPIRDTEGALRPAISPDAQEVAFTFGSSIRVVPLQEGVSRTFAGLTARGGGTPRWSPDGAWIYYSDTSEELSCLPSGGGMAEVITQVDTAAGDALHAYVDVLPGNHVVYTVFGPDRDPRIQAVDIETGEIRDLTTGRYPRYSNTEYLLFQDATAAAVGR